VTSGVRIGTPAMTTRGFGAAEAEKLAHLIAEVLEDPSGEVTAQRVRGELKALCERFPVYA
jgi:glycine hydroxymethyltransferase